MGKDLKGKNLGIGITQRADGIYYARAIVNGQKIELYGSNLAELRRKFEREKERVKRCNLTTCKNITVMEWFDMWFEQYKKPTLKPTGVANYRRKFVNTYGKLLGSEEVAKLTQFSVQTATAALIEKKYTNKTIRDALAVLKLLFDSAISNYLVQSNPCYGIIVPTYNEIKEDRRVLSKEEQSIFLDYINNSFYKEVYQFMLITGVRVGEMGALKWNDIDFETEFITIRHSLSCQYNNGKKSLTITTPKTTNSFRKIPFFKETKSILLSQKKKQEELRKQLGDRWRSEEQFEGLVFTTSMGSPIIRHALEHDMRKISNDLNMKEYYTAIEEHRTPTPFEPIHPHCLRHTFATRCFEKGIQAKTVQRIMGHANINMTMSYTHALDDVVKDEIDNIGSFFDNNKHE